MKKTLLFVTILSFSLLNAQVIFKENFSTYTTGVQLAGQGVFTNNSSNAGGLGTCAGFGCPNAKVLATAINYAGYGISSNNSFELKPDLDGCGRAFSPVAAGDLLVGMVLNLSVAPATTTNDFFRVMSGGNFNVAFKLYARASGSGYVVGISKGASSTVTFSTTVLTYTQDNLVILKYTILSGLADDVLNIYSNPIYANGTPAIADATITAGTDQTGSIDRMVFRQNTAAGTPTGRLGLLSFAQTWSELGFAPLSTIDFQQSTFKVNGFKANNGILEITSNQNIKGVTVNIYSILGSLVQSKKVDLLQNLNSIEINPVANAAVYIVEVVAANGSRFSQKIIVY